MTRFGMKFVVFKETIPNYVKSKAKSTVYESIHWDGPSVVFKAKCISAKMSFFSCLIGVCLCMALYSRCFMWEDFVSFNGVIPLRQNSYKLCIHVWIPTQLMAKHKEQGHPRKVCMSGSKKTRQPRMCMCCRIYALGVSWRLTLSISTVAISLKRKTAMIQIMKYIAVNIDANSNQPIRSNLITIPITLKIMKPCKACFSLYI